MAPTALAPRPIALALAGLCVVALLATCQAARPLTEAAPARGLLYDRSTRANVGANTVRSQAATAQAIEEAVDSGANGYATRRAGVVGSTMTWAAAQNDQYLFNAAERFSNPVGRK